MWESILGDGYMTYEVERDAVLLVRALEMGFVLDSEKSKRLLLQNSHWPY